MDDDPNDFSELEAELRSLRPRALSKDFVARVERSINEPRSVFVSAKKQGFFELLAWPVAASFVGIVAWLSHGSSAAVSRASTETPGNASIATTYKPVEAKNILYDVREEGLTTLPDGTPARQVRDRYLDVITWKNAAATSSVSWTVARDEVHFVPIEAY